MSGVSELWATSILTTKFQRPVPSANLIARPQLTDQLQAALHLPLALISAPAGYGKSTLISQWLSECQVVSAWLSLDADDNAPITFLMYLAHAVNAVIPDLCNPTLATLDLTNDPHILCNAFINDLNRLAAPLILVLDDYHYIDDNRIHDLMFRLLKYLPQSVHLVVATRRDPPWPLVEMRARNQLIELHVTDLAFSDREMRQFFSQFSGSAFDTNYIAQLTRNLEGWPGGLRLVALALRNSLPNGDQPARLNTNIHAPSDAFLLMQEVLGRQPAALQRRLMQVSVLDRFCAPLLDAIVAPDHPASDGVGQDMIRWLQRSELFLIPLDNEGYWYRFHHLFQWGLQQLLAQTASAETIAGLHHRAADWFAAEGWINEAINHALAAQDEHRAIKLIAAYRHEAINQEDWHQLERWLAKFPPERIQAEPELLVTQALREDGMFWMTRVDLEHIEDLPAWQQLSPEEARVLRAEADGLRAGQCNQRGDYEQGILLARRALENLPANHIAFRLVTRVRLGAVQMLQGDRDGVFRTLEAARAEPQIHDLRHRIRVAQLACQAYWGYALHNQLEAEALYILDQCQPGLTRGIFESWAFARNYLGYLAYLQNQPDQALAHFQAVVEHRYQISPFALGEGMRGLVLVYQILGLATQARSTLDDLEKYQLEYGLSSDHQDIRLFQAEWHLRNNWKHDALAAVEQADILPLRIFEHVRWFVPHLTAIKVLVAQPSPEKWQQAQALLDQLLTFERRMGNERLLAEALAVQAVLLAAQGAEDQAFGPLQQAIEMAEPRGFVRSLADAGPGLYPLLVSYARQRGHSTFIDAILAALRPPAAPTFPQAPFESLTDREQEILQLLARRMSNQEIADCLLISVATVKRHNLNIFGKLDAKNRRDAVVRAQAMGLLNMDIH